RGSALTSGHTPLTAFRSAINTVAPALTAEIWTGPGSGADAETAAHVWSARALTFADAVADRARRAPVFLAVDDAQSLDDASLAASELIRAAIADTASPLQLLIVMTHRSIGAPDQALARIDRLARASGASELRLSGLDEPGLGELVADATSLHATPALIDGL